MEWHFFDLRALFSIVACFVLFYVFYFWRIFLVSRRLGKPLVGGILVFGQKFIWRGCYLFLLLVA